MDSSPLQKVVWNAMFAKYHQGPGCRFGDLRQSYLLPQVESGVKIDRFMRQIDQLFVGRGAPPPRACQGFSVYPKSCKKKPLLAILGKA